MKLQLTPQETEYMIFKEGDYYEAFSGTITFSGRRTANRPYYNRPLTELDFFFESTDPGFGTQQSWISTDAEIPNGPALLVMYRRVNEVNSFGIVSMVNRSWTHAIPLMSLELIRQSPRAGLLQNLLPDMHNKSPEQAAKGALRSFGKLAAVVAGTAMTGGLGAGAAIKAVYGGDIKKKQLNDEMLGATVRGLMFRISKNADAYWEGGGGGISGKL